MIRSLQWLMAVDAVLIVICMVFGEQSWLHSTQVGYWSSTLVLSASLFSYQRMVNQRLSDGSAVPDDDRDVIDTTEDPYDLYDDEKSGNENSDVNAETLREAIADEKQTMKQNRRSVLEVIRDSRGALSLYRLGAYLLLFFGFFYLTSSTLMHLPSYLIALALPIVVVVTLLLSKKDESETGI